MKRLGLFILLVVLRFVVYAKMPSLFVVGMGEDLGGNVGIIGWREYSGLFVWLED